MNLVGFCIDGFGAWSGLEQTGLSSGLNVLHGPNGSGKTTIARFLRAALYGFDSHDQRHFMPAHGAGGGSVTIQTAEGVYCLRRRQDGSPRGAAALETVAGVRRADHALARLLTDAPEAVFRTVFSVGFRDLPSTEALVRQASADGLDLAAVEVDRRPLDHALAALDREARRLEGAGGVVEQLLEQRRRLGREREALADEERRGSGQASHLRRELDEKIAACQARAARLRRQCESDGPVDELRKRESKLAAIEAQIERWRRVKLDATARRRRLRDELVHWATGAEMAVDVSEEPGRQIESLERRMERLQAEASSTARRLADCPQCGDAARHRLSPLVAGVRDEVYLLRRELGRRQVALRRDAITHELRQLRRCHAEVTTHLDRLIRRRDEAAAKLARERSRILERQARREAWAEELRRVEAELAGLRRRRDSLLDWDSAAHRRRLAAVRLELLTVDRQLAEALERRAATAVALSVARPMQHAAPATRRSGALEEASSYLARMSFGEFRQIRLLAESHAVRVEDERGQWLSLDALSRGAHDLVHLSLTLALVAAYERRGVRAPLVLDDLFVHIDERTAEGVARILHDFAAAGRQILLFTCHHHIARVFRDLGAAVRDLPDCRRIGPAPPPAVDPAERVIHISLDKRSAPDVWHVNGEEQEPDSFAAVDLAAASDEKSAFYLHAASPIEEAPGVDADAAARLRLAGVTTIGDLLAADERDTAALVKRRDVSGETIRRWQAMARLVCSVPGLRPYDAKLLLAAGVSHPEELRLIEADELLRRIERVLATEEGRRIFRSGSDDELARVAGWIRAARSYRSLRERRRLANDVERREAKGSHERKPRRQSPRPPRPKPRAWKFYLDPSSPIGASPSIGPRTADRLKAVGVHTVKDLLAAQPERLAEKLRIRRLDAAVVREWQDQARLVCEVPRLRGHDAQLLVGCGVRTAEEVASASPSELLALVEPFCRTAEGERILRSAAPPDLAEVTDWVEWARHARRLHAA